MLGWLKIIKKKFNKLPAIGQFLVASVIILVVRQLLKIIIYQNYKFGYLEGMGNPAKVYYFHMTGCGHCKDFTPTWENFSSSYSGPVKLVKMEQKEAHGKKLLEKYNVKGFPSVVKVDENGSYEEFNSERTLNNLKTFIN
jgi:thiol-disulfide isomerase/thioredoxin